VGTGSSSPERRSAPSRTRIGVPVPSRIRSSPVARSQRSRRARSSASARPDAVAREPPRTAPARRGAHPGLERSGARGRERRGLTGRALRSVRGHCGPHKAQAAAHLRPRTPRTAWSRASASCSDRSGWRPRRFPAGARGSKANGPVRGSPLGRGRPADAGTPPTGRASGRRSGARSCAAVVPGLVVADQSRLSTSDSARVAGDALHRHRLGEQVVYLLAASP
jgi:hypothetical protein